MQNRYRTVALRLIRLHLADLPADRRRAFADVLEAALRKNDRTNSSNRDRRVYQRDLMRRLRATAKAKRDAQTSIS